MSTETLEETVPDVIRVKCLSQPYYRDQMREKDSIINFYTEDMDKGVIKVGPNKGKPKPGMPKWAKIVPPDTPLTLRDGEDAEDVTTLSQMSKKGNPAQQKAAQKVKDDQKKLDADRVQFEKEKAEFKASKDAPEDKGFARGAGSEGGDPADTSVKENDPKTAKKKWRGTTKKK